jgi:hypothetical protein
MLRFYFYCNYQIKFSSINISIFAIVCLKLQENFTPILTINYAIIFQNYFIFLHSVEKFIPNIIHILSLFGLCVTAFFLSPRHDRNSRLVSLEPVWLEKCPSKNNFPEKWPVAKLPTEKNVLPMLFYGKNLALFVFMFETQSYCKSKVPNAGFALF